VRRTTRPESAAVRLARAAHSRHAEVRVHGLAVTRCDGADLLSSRVVDYGGPRYGCRSTARWFEMLHCCRLRGGPGRFRRSGRAGAGESGAAADPEGARDDQIFGGRFRGDVRARVGGLRPDGVADEGYRGRELERNAAVARLALASGLRRAEFTYLLVYEVPALPTGGAAGAGRPADARDPTPRPPRPPAAPPPRRTDRSPGPRPSASAPPH